MSTKSKYPPLPKRKKAFDNPYTIGFDPIQQQYTLEFRDVNRQIQKIYISQALGQLFDEFELEDVHFVNQDARHLSNYQDYEIVMIEQAPRWKASTLAAYYEQKVQNQELWRAIERLPAPQSKRRRLYYLQGYSCSEIAKMEGCSVQAVSKSIIKAKTKLKKLLQQG